MNAPEPTVAAIAIACHLASKHPDAMLPCPVCPAKVNAGNLSKHLAKAHKAEMAKAVSPHSDGSMRLRGKDRRIFRPALALLVLWGLGAATLAFLRGGALSDLEAGLFGATALFVVGLVGATSAGLFRGALELQGDRLRLRWFFGLASYDVVLPATLESGTWTQKRISNVNLANTNPDYETVRAGAYLRIRSNGRAITVGAKRAPKLGKHWAPKGWTQFKKTGAVDLELERGQLVALEYQLARRGQLSLKTT